LPDLSDDELVLLYRDGDAEAFEVLFDRYRAPIYNFACTMLNNAAKAEDILQETFLGVARAAKSYEPRGRFRTWLFRIARNMCLNAVESERLRRAAASESRLILLDPPSDEPSPLDQSGSNEFLRNLRREISGLPDRQREAISLYAFEQMPYREIADVLDVPLNTVKSLIHRARVSLAAALEKSSRR